jgi:ribosomal protein L7/L12
MVIGDKMEKIKDIKDITGCSLKEAVEALESANGDLLKALEIVIELNKEPTIDSTDNQ